MSNKGRWTDRALGMDQPIDRRDFLNGVAVAIGALGVDADLGGVAGAETPAGQPQDQPGYYPPTLTGLRGSHPGSFENAHKLRDGDFWSSHSGIEDTGERYDLIIVGGGISGLSAAYFYRASRPDARILILDNHDDFGGHAKRNEFHLGGKLHLLNGGTLEIDSPRPYSPVAGGLLRSLGIDPVALSKSCNRDDLYPSLGLTRGLFFDRETFGEDRLLTGAPGHRHAASVKAWRAFAAGMPLSPAARRDIVWINTGMTDYMPGLTSDAKKDALSRMSRRDYLLKVVKADPGAVAFYQTSTLSEWGVGIDAVSALDCWGFGMRMGFQGLKLKPGSAPRMGYTAEGYADGGSDTFHFPDGNATIARLLVRDLIPGAIPGRDCRDIVTANTDYGRLDRPDAQVRIRLSSIVVRARNLAGDKAESTGVEVAYVRGDRVFRVTAADCVLASWNMMIPYLCPELPAAQKAALRSLVKSPLVYTSVALRNWTAFHALGIEAVDAPGGYHSAFHLNRAVDIGDYACERSPDKPILLHMERIPCKPGLSEHAQNRAGRAELLTTTFETFERNIREQLGRTLAGGGFDPARDITGITVNRWPHGYAPEYNSLFDPDLPADQQPNVVGRARFGRIANSDAGLAAYTDAAIDQAHRAVSELLAL